MAKRDALQPPWNGLQTKRFSVSKAAVFVLILLGLLPISLVAHTYIIAANYPCRLDV